MITKKFIRQNAWAWGILYLLILLSQFAGERPAMSDISSTTMVFITVVAIFYIHFLVCEQFFYKSKLLYVLSVVTLFGLYLLLIYSSDVKPELPALKMEHRGVRFLLFLYMSLYFFILVLLSGFYWSSLYAAKMQNEKMHAEKKFLQSQINPHFLYNTLNFFYAKSLNISKELSQGIMTLSEIMKYSLQKKENDKGLVALSEEVRHLQNIIYIYQLRFNHRLQIRVSIPSAMDNVMILPLTLITLVENALKHGELHEADAPVQINLLCDEAKQRLFFAVYNKKRTGPKEEGTGIGLDNTKKRLAWMYSSNYSLETTDEGNYFKAELSVPLYSEGKL